MLTATHNSRGPQPRRWRGLGSPQTDQYIGTGVATGVSVASAIPSALPALIGASAASVVGLVAAPLIGIIASILGNHAAAVAREANDLNSAVPAFANALQAIFGALNAGQISPDQAVASGGYLDQAVAAYYGAVNTIISKGQSCAVYDDCTYPTNSSGNPPFNPCNGPCSVGCAWVEPAACQARRAIANPGSVETVRSLSSHAGFNGFQSFQLSYNPPVPVTSPAAVTSGNSVPATGMVSPAASGDIAWIESEFASPTPVGMLLGGLVAFLLLRAIV